MKRNVLALSILLALGISNTLANPTPAPQNQPQTVIKLSEDEKNKIYQDFDKKLDEKLKNNINPYKDSLDKTIDMLKYFCTLLFGMLAGALTLNYFKLKTEVESSVKKEVGESVNKAVIDEVEKSKTVVIELLNNKLENSVSVIDNLISLEHAKRQLLFVVEDIEAPSIRHSVSPQAKEQIIQFLNEIYKFQEDLEKLGTTKDIGNTLYNQKIAGKAHHYLGGKDNDGIEHYKKAIFHFDTILKSQKDNNEFNKDEIYLCLGNSYSGMNDYPKALSYYDQIRKGISDDSAIKMHISKGDAYKSMLNFKAAISQFHQVVDMRKKKDSYYWESLYGEACALVDDGNYTDAGKLYDEFINVKENEKTFIEPVWLNVTIGDFYRKKGSYADSQIYYDRAVAISGIHGTGINEINYKLGRLYVDKGQFTDANKIFMNISPDKVDNPNLLKIFWGYSLIKDNREIEGKEKIREALIQLEEIVKDFEKQFLEKNKENDYKYLECYPYYCLSIGFAMQDETKMKAIDYLTSLIDKPEFYFVKHWATASNCSDFVKIQTIDSFRKIVGLIS